MFVILSGVIGVGKTTIAEKLSASLGWDAIYETVEEHPYLGTYYRDLKDFENTPISTNRLKLRKSAFETQIHFLFDRFQKHFEARSRKNVIADRSIYEDQVFARMLTDCGKMSSDNFFKTYIPHFQLLTGLLRPPELMIFLTASVDTVISRQIDRGRDMESALPREYNEDLSRYYEEWFSVYPFEKIRVNTEGKTTDEIVNEITEIIKSKTQVNTEVFARC